MNTYVTTHDHLGEPCTSSPRKDEGHVVTMTRNHRGRSVVAVCHNCDRTARWDRVWPKQ